ncbi:MAG: sugar phosphate isomerase/epimerase [Clostridia bacterium]|nr:sugar phosphate isomerase/epimerase [Clostridia bacterium]
MKTGIVDSAYLYLGSHAAAFERMKQHGYDCTDYQGLVHTEDPLFALDAAGFERTLRGIRRDAENAGIEIYQAHGPWRWPPQDSTPEEREERFEKMSRSILGCQILGCPNFIIHPIMPFGDWQDPEPEKLWEMNLEFFSRLCEVAKAHDTTICFENMPMLALSLSTPEQILRFVKQIDSPYMRVCLDTGHCSVFGLSPADAVRLLGKEYLRALHVHDNDGRADRHMLPGEGVIDWDDFAKALAEIDCTCPVSIETQVSGKTPADQRDAAERELANIAKRLAGQI